MESWELQLQEDKSSWAKIDVNSNDMLTKFVTIKGEDVFAKKPYKEIKVNPGYPLNAPDQKPQLSFSGRGRVKAVCSLHNLQLHTGVFLEGEK